MLSISTLVVLTFCYLLLLFAIAFVGDKYQLPDKLKPIVYSLGLGVYCTSWAFYGVTGQTAKTDWWFTPTYTGAILVYLLAWPLVLKVARICREQSVTSLADFIASRYGKSSSLAGLVTLVSVFAIIPYIAMQLRAITDSFNAVIPIDDTKFGFDVTLFFTLTLLIFAILFGTRRIRPSEHNPGLLLAIAFESIVKLITFLAIGVFVCFFVFDGVADLFNQALLNKNVQAISSPPAYVYVTQTLLGVLMMFCLPRQFHMTFIEQDKQSDVMPSRWLFPLYMVAINLFALPIAYAGLMLLPGSGLGSDGFMLQLPMLAGSDFMTIVSYLGGFSAATSMVIVATIVLSIMVSNDLVTPKLLVNETGMHQRQRLSPSTLLLVRRISIFIILLAAYAYHQIASNSQLLAVTGLMSMTLVAQFAPALLLGLIWRSANVIAARRSIVVGTFLWVYTLLIPSLNGETFNLTPLLEQGLMGISWLKPTSIFGLNMEFISHGVLISLSVNVLVFIYYSLVKNPELVEQLQSLHYLANKNSLSNTQYKTSLLTNKDVQQLMSRFFGQEKANTFVQEFYSNQNVNWQHTAPAELERLVEQQLSGVLGGSSAKLLLDSAGRRRTALLNDVVDIVDEASDLLRFNRSLLQSTIQNVEQGISVVDKELRIVAWNRRYIEMFHYPEAEIFVGRPVEEVLRFNAKRGFFGEKHSELEIAKRIAYLEEGKSYRFQRVQTNGQVYEMSGNPLPGGGFVTTYSDITEYVKTQRALEEINAHLESRVEQRTEDLQKVNQRLELAKKDAEQANIDKTKYFAALSHDLLQPFNAANLFASILSEKIDEAQLDREEVLGLTGNISQSLSNAEQLLSSILEITKLDAGATKPYLEDFCIEEFLQPIVDEFTLCAQEKGLDFEAKLAVYSTRSDKHLLRRVLQNLLTNAIRYTEQGRINLLVEENDNELLVRVQDTGVGIKDSDQSRIFHDFEQVNQGGTKVDAGLGLGLAITERICRLLGMSLSVHSVVGKGSCFTLRLPIIKRLSREQTPILKSAGNRRDLAGLAVLVIDNDPIVLTAMSKRLAEWGCTVQQASDKAQAIALAKQYPTEIILADYHLDDGVTGVSVASAIRTLLSLPIPVIVNSADHSEDLHEQVVKHGFVFINKPVKPAALKRAIKQSLA